MGLFSSLYFPSLLMMFWTRNWVMATMEVFQLVELRHPVQVELKRFNLGGKIFNNHLELDGLVTGEEVEEIG